jgi:uncharacterized protein (TIGR02996 family)
MNEDQLRAAEPFLRAIVDNPDDALPRLVFADWLAEQGFDRKAEWERRLAGRMGIHPDDPGGRDMLMQMLRTGLARPDDPPVPEEPDPTDLAGGIRIALQIIARHSEPSPPPLSWWRLLLRFLRRCHDRAVQARG